MSDNIRSTAHTCTHGVMSRWLLVFLAASMMPLAGCDGTSTSTVAKPDSTKNAPGEVARGTDPNGTQTARASDSVAQSAGTNDTATGLSPGRTRHDEIS